MNSLLKDFRKQKTKVSKSITETPGVSRQLIHWLKNQFSPENMLANDPLMAQKLIIQRGIDMVVNKLEVTNAQQEAGIKEANLSDSPNRAIRKDNDGVFPNSK